MTTSGGAGAAASGSVNAFFVCGGKWHDMDFARVELLRSGLRWARGGTGAV